MTSDSGELSNTVQEEMLYEEGVETHEEMNNGENLEMEPQYPHASQSDTLSEVSLELIEP